MKKMLFSNQDFRLRQNTLFFSAGSEKVAFQVHFHVGAFEPFILINTFVEFPR